MGATGARTEPAKPRSVQRDGCAASSEQLETVVRTYRRIWARLPQLVKAETMAAMRCWSPLDYEVMVAEDKRHNDPSSEVLWAGVFILGAVVRG